ncbi:MAG: transposase [Elainellaceae cyanobacterium]
MRQWVQPKDHRHLQGFAEAVAAILLSQSACLGRWIPYLTHRDCQARAHLARLSYFLHNEHISSERFYIPLLRQFLQGFSGSDLILTLDSSLLGERFCLVEVCLAWGGRSIPLAQVVLEHASATVSFEQYQNLLETARVVLPAGCRVTLLADRGFEHGALLRWLAQQQWAWAIRAKSDLRVTLAEGSNHSVAELIAASQTAHLYHNVTVIGDIGCHLATAHVREAQESWAVLTSEPPTLQTFALYGQRFGGIEPHFKDYKSAALALLDSGLQDARALTCLLMLLTCASLIALVLAMLLVRCGQRTRLDWHGQRGLSFLQLGLREVARRCYEGIALPQLNQLPKCNPPPACASRRKREALDCRIEFSKVVVFS